MANIPTIPSVQQVQDPNIGVKVDPGPTQARFRQLQQTVGAAGGAVEEGLLQVADYEHRKQQANEAAFYSKTFISVDKTTAAFAKASKALDPNEIVPQWTDQAATLRDQIQGDPEYARMSKAAQNKLNLHLMDVVGKSTSDFQAEADVRQSINRWSTALAARNQSLASDPENIKRANTFLTQQAMDAPPDGGLEKALAQTPKLANEHQILNDSEVNPTLTRDNLDAGKYSAVSGDPQATKEWKDYLNRAITRRYTEGIQKVYAQAGPDGIIPDHVIKDAMSGPNPQIEPKAGEILLKTQARQTYKEDDDNRKLLMAGVRNPDEWKTDPAQAQHDFLQEAAGIKNPQVRAEAVSEINRQAASVAKTGNTAERPLERQALQGLKTDPLNVAAKQIKSLTEKLGDDYLVSDADIKARYGGQTRDEVVRGLQLDEADQRDKMHQFFQDHAKDHAGQGPTEHETEAYREGLVMAPHIAKAAAQVATTPYGANPAGLAKIQENLAAGKPWYDGSPQTVRVKNKQGQVGSIPAANLKKALAAGYTIEQ